MVVGMVHFESQQTRGKYCFCTTKDFPHQSQWVLCWWGLCMHHFLKTDPNSQRNSALKCCASMLCATWVWVFVFPTLINSYAQILIPPRKWLWRGRDFGSPGSHEWDACFIKEATESFLEPSTKWGYNEKSGTWKWALLWPCWHSSPRTVNNKCLLLGSHPA